MHRRRKDPLDLTGMLVVVASVVAVVLVIVAALTDRSVVLAVAAVTAAVAIVLVVVRRSSMRGGALPVAEPTLDLSDAAPADVDREGAEEAERYQDDAVTARADLLATLRHGFRADGSRRSATDSPADGPSEDSSTTTSTAAEAADTSGAPATAEGSRDPLTPAPTGTDRRAPVGSGSADRRARSIHRDPLLDADTGLFTQDFFEASLPKRVSAARRGLRPLSVAAVAVVTGRPVGRAPAADVTLVAEAMTEVFRDADTIAVADDGVFLILLEDTPEAGAVWTLERLRRRLTAEDAGRTMWAGVSCYPAYSFDADGLIGQARDALDSARQWQQDRIEIAAHAAD